MAYHGIYFDACFLLLSSEKNFSVIPAAIDFHLNHSPYSNGDELLLFMLHLAY